MMADNNLTLTPAPPAPAGRIGLRSGQIVACLIVGAVLWFIAALMLRYMGPMGAYEGSSRAILYALIVPGTIPFLMAGFRIAHLGAAHRFVGTGVMLMAAMLLDGIALAWFPGLYGHTPDLVAGAGGTILWGAGIALVLGFFMNKQTTET